MAIYQGNVFEDRLQDLHPQLPERIPVYCEAIHSLFFPVKNQIILKTKIPCGAKKGFSFVKFLKNYCASFLSLDLI